MSNKFDKVAYQREYMRKRRAKQRGDAESKVCTGQPERENDRPTVPDAVGEIPTPATRSAKDVVGGIYRNDNGGVISKFAWEKLQKMKKKAETGGYELDDYSQ